MSSMIPPEDVLGIRRLTAGVAEPQATDRRGMRHKNDRLGAAWAARARALPLPGCLELRDAGRCGFGRSEAVELEGAF
eukprot:7468833-Alexandrium_andersonii.AAC.1